MLKPVTKVVIGFFCVDGTVIILSSISQSNLFGDMCLKNYHIIAQKRLL